MAKKKIMPDTPYDLSKCAKAFGLLGANSSGIPDLVRYVMIFVALNFDLQDSENKKAIEKLFSGANYKNVLNCLDQIKKTTPTRAV